MIRTRKKNGTKIDAGNAGTVRASISFPSAVYETLEDIARNKKVSVAWVVREAAELYIGDKWPLFSRQGRETQ
jgi:hypothetical protein